MKFSSKATRWPVAVLCLLCFSCGCGIFGGGEGGAGGGEVFSDPFASNVVKDINVAKQVATVFWDEGYVVVSGVNKDQTRLFGILIPFSLYASAKPIPLGADGFLSESQREGTFVLYQGTDLLGKNKKIEAVYVSGSGSLNLQRASFNYEGPVRGTVHLDRLFAVDNRTGLFTRSTTSGTASLEFDARMRSGPSTEYPVVFSINKSAVSKGEVVEVKGANLSRLTRVGYVSCNSLSLPFEILSDHEARVTINEYPCSPKAHLYFSPGYFDLGPFPLEVMPPPHLKNILLPKGFYSSRGGITHDTRDDLLLFKDSGKRLLPFSFTEGRFKGNIYWREYISSLDYLSHDNNLYVTYYPPWRVASGIYSLEGMDQQDFLTSVVGGPTLDDIPEQVLFGKGRKGFVASSWDLKGIDLDTRTVSSLPWEWRTPYGSIGDGLLRSWSREYILVNRPEGSRNPTVIFRSLQNGNFERTTSVVIGQKVLGISEAADEVWTLSSVYDVQLNRLSDYGGSVPNWQPQNAIGIVFDPGNRYAILIVKSGGIHILNRQTREVLASNVPAVPFSALELYPPHFLSADGGKLLLTSRQMLHLVDLREIFRSVGLEY